MAMKKLLYLSIIAYVLAACTNLDEKIYSNIPKEEFFRSKEQLVVYSARAYNKLQAWGSEQSIWTLNIQLGDEIAVPKNSVNDWADPRYKELQTHNISNSNKLVRMGWDYCFDGIAACNDVLYETEHSGMEFDGKDRIIAEMKVLRAFFYFLAVDCWGNVPFSVSKEESGYPEQKGRVFMCEFLEKELLENLDKLADKPTPEYYGRMTRGVAKTLLAKLYLNSEVWTGKARWDDAEKVCKEIMDTGHYSLEPDYRNNFAVHNETSKEQIFAIPYSTIYTKSDHNDFVIFIMTLTPTMCKGYNIPAAGWDGFIAQPDFFATYEDADIRRSGTFLYGQQKGSDGKDIDGYIINPDCDEAAYSNGRAELQGARIGKWEYQSDGLLTNDQTSMENDFFVMRYADVVLMCVEALVRQGKIAEASAVPEFRDIRTRAGLVPFTAENLNLETLYNERGHELALEGWRRNDQIRFDTFRNTWWAKPDKTADHALLLPIPRERLAANPNLKQNEGYK